MSQPYGGQPQPGGQYPGSGGFQQPGGQNPHSGGFQQPGGQHQGYGSMPQAPQEYSSGPIARPGAATASAVLAFVQGGITTITTLLVWIGAFNAADIGGSEVAIQFALAVAQTVGLVLLFWGGVQLIQGTGRTLLVAGCALEIVIAIGWLARTAAVDDAGIDLLEDAKGMLMFIAVIFAIMPAISLILAQGGPTKEYVNSRRR